MSTLYLPALAWSLLDFLWQGALVGWTAALLLAAMGRRSPQARYAVACGALLLCAALPLAGLMTRLQAAEAPQAMLPLMLTAAGAIDWSAAPATASGWQPHALDAARNAALGAVLDALQARLPLVLTLWSAGAAALALRLLLGLWWVRRRTDPAASRLDAHWQGRAQAMAGRLGVKRAVRVGIVDDIRSPLTAGWWRPVVLLPAALLSGMPSHLLEALLAHELAHIRRHDYLVNLLQSAVEIALFYHPTVWWLSRRIRAEREQVADDIAATLLGEPRRLAVALSELDRFQLIFERSTQHQLAHAAHGGHLMQRIKRLVCKEAEPLGLKMLVPACGLAAACFTYYANAQSMPPVPPVPPMPPMARMAPVPPVPPVPPVAAVAPVPPVAAVAPPAPPVPPAPPAPPARHSSKGEPYAVVRPGHAGINGSSTRSDWQQLEAAKRSIHGEFLWFHQNGKPYVVRDPAVLSQVVQAWAPIDKLTEEMDVYGKQMEVHGQKMEALGHQMEKQALSGSRANSREMDRLSREQERLGREMNRLGAQMADADRSRRAQLQTQMNELGARMGDLGAQMGKEGARQALAQQPLEATGRQMEEAQKPMEALGRSMEALGKKIEAQAEISEKATRLAIRDAVAKGLAQPAP